MWPESGLSNKAKVIYFETNMQIYIYHFYTGLFLLFLLVLINIPSVLQLLLI